MPVFTAGMTSASYYNNLTWMQKLYNVKEYGALGNDSDDDTVAIQAAINAAFTAGGGIVWFPVGIYIIGGALQTNVGGINYKSQLYIPDSNAATRTRANVLLKGEIGPNYFQGVGIGASIPLYSTTSGVILKSTLESATALSYVIASRGAAGNAVANMNYNQCNIEDIQIHVLANASYQITLGGVGFNDAANTIVRNVSVFSHNLNTNDSAAAINNAIGIAMPRVDCEHINILENCNVGGFDTGFLTGEHTSLKDTIAICCKYGYQFGQASHHVSATRIASYWCINDLYFTGVVNVKINGLQIEWADNAKWYDNAYTILDASDYGHGEVHYCITEYGVGFNDAKFNKSGGANLQCMPIAFAAASSFTVTGARDETEGALKDLIAKLVAKGIIVDGTTAS